MRLRYFEIRSPLPDFTGKLGSVSFADGVARVSFDDERDEQGLAVPDEHQVQVGRSAVLFALRRPGYRVVEVDADGKPLEAKPAEKPQAEHPDAPTRSASKADWVTYASSEKADGQRLTAEAAEALTRDQLAEKFLGPKES